MTALIPWDTPWQIRHWFGQWPDARHADTGARCDRITGRRRVTIGRGSRVAMIDARPGHRRERVHIYIRNPDGSRPHVEVHNQPPIVADMSVVASLRIARVNLSCSCDDLDTSLWDELD